MLKLNLSVRYDQDLSRIYFEDFKDGVDGSQVLLLGDRSVDYCVIFENAEIMDQSYFKKSRLARMKIADLHDLSIHLNRWWNEDKRKSEIIDDLMEITNADFYKSHYENENYSDLDYNFSVSGYSQGDFVKVKKVGSAEWSEKSYNADYLTNLFFDCPISGMIELVELSESSSGFLSDCAENQIFEIHIDELLEDQYSYSKDEIISSFEKLNLSKLSDRIDEISIKYNVFLKGYIKDYLIENLPENPEYCY